MGCVQEACPTASMATEDAIGCPPKGRPGPAVASGEIGGLFPAGLGRGFRGARRRHWPRSGAAPRSSHGIRSRHWLRSKSQGRVLPGRQKTPLVPFSSRSPRLPWRQKSALAAQRSRGRVVCPFQNPRPRPACGPAARAAPYQEAQPSVSLAPEVAIEPSPKLLPSPAAPQRRALATFSSLGSPLAWPTAAGRRACNNNRGAAVNLIFKLFAGMLRKNS